MHSESQWRYRASCRGLRLVKYKQDSTAYQQYGPYSLVDRATNRMAFTGLDAEAVERELFSGPDEEPAEAPGCC
ncbi:MAG: hypothetical protein U0R66_14590 [Mycobacterium sp.]